MLRAFCAAAVLAAALPDAGLAQSRDRAFGRSAADWCADHSNRDRATHCEVREQTIPAISPLDIDAGRNGGIRVRGSDRSDVLVRSKIVGYADAEADARRLVAGVRVEAAGGRVRVDGPDTRRDEGWSVSLEVDVPRRGHVILRTVNGGISIDDFQGTAEFHARNGGVTLTNLGGDIRGETTNGGVTVELRGDRWEGAGLDVETRNGGVRIAVPERYSAELETGTTNGRISIDFPVTVQGRIGRQLNTVLGGGGARIRVITTNGGVTIRQR